MRRMLVLAVLAIGACSTTVTEQERRWKALDGKQMWMVTEYGTTVHGVKDCPKLAAAKAPAKPCTVKKGRVMDEQGLYATGPGVLPDLCPTCVK